jgi:hypothetical protein
MSRYEDHSDDDDPDMILARGRWQANARRALRGRRGQRALRQMREALMALPERRLIEGAMCTVGGIDRRAPEVSAGELAECRARATETAVRYGGDAASWADGAARGLQADRTAYREALEDEVARNNGCGVCLIGAYLWYLKVLDGMDPAEAFDALPTILGTEDGGLDETADYVVQVADIARTMAWELAFLNDERFGEQTPEGRWQAIAGWLDGMLGDSVILTQAQEAGRVG